MADINIQDIIQDLGLDKACELHNLYPGMNIYLSSKPNQLVEALAKQGLDPKEISRKLNNMSIHKVYKILACEKQRDRVTPVSLFPDIEIENNNN